MNSWERLACYPRRTFYPLIDGPSTQNHRVTMTDFRLCSTCMSRSQAGLCHCTQQLLSKQLEPTFVRLRYSLGGDRPSQTTHHTLSLTWITEEVRKNKYQGRYFKGASTQASAHASKATVYPTHDNYLANVKL